MEGAARTVDIAIGLGGAGPKVPMAHGVDAGAGRLGEQVVLVVGPESTMTDGEDKHEDEDGDEGEQEKTHGGESEPRVAAVGICAPGGSGMRLALLTVNHAVLVEMEGDELALGKAI